MTQVGSKGNLEGENIQQILTLQFVMRIYQKHIFFNFPSKS